MPRVIFWDVDTQYDFMKADGKLYVPDAEQLVANLKKLTDYAHGHGIRIVASADDHVAEHAEISATPIGRRRFHRIACAVRLVNERFPRPRCATPGHRARAAGRRGAGGTSPRPSRRHPVHKHRFDVFSNPNVLPVLDVLNPPRHRPVRCRARRLRQIRNRRAAAPSAADAHLRGRGRDEADRPRCGRAAAQGVGRRRRPPRQDERSGRGRPWSTSSCGPAHDLDSLAVDARGGEGGRGSRIRKVLPSRSDRRSSEVLQAMVRR